MNGTNEKLLKKLYGIRAGLSLIAQEKDEVKIAKQKLIQPKETLSKLQKKYNANKDNYEPKRQQLLQDMERHKQEASRLHYSFWKHTFFPFLIRFLLYLLCLAGIVLLVIVPSYILIKWLLGTHTPTSKWVPSLIALISGLSILGTYTYLWIDEGDNPFVAIWNIAVLPFKTPASIQSQKNTSQKEARDCQSQLSLLQQEIDSTSKIPQLQREYTENEKTVADFSTKKQQLSNAILEKLRKTYSPILDERDWKYLDLITFYVETGRADTVKEALQLVDRQVQVNSILSAMQQATRAITESIQINTHKMMQIVYESTNLLSTQLGNIQGSLNTTILQNNQILEQNRSSLEQSKRIESAFQKYATTSSESLYTIARNQQDELRRKGVV